MVIVFILIFLLVVVMLVVVEMGISIVVEMLSVILVWVIDVGRWFLVLKLVGKWDFLWYVVF